MTPFAGCAHCGARRFLAGPRGGASINVACEACGARFNVVLVPAGPLLLEELSGPGEVDRQLFGGYIIEVIPEGRGMS